MWRELSKFYLSLSHYFLLSAPQLFSYILNFIKRENKLFINMSTNSHKAIMCCFAPLFFGRCANRKISKNHNILKDKYLIKSTVVCRHAIKYPLAV